MAFWELNKELDFGLCGRRSEEEDHASAIGDRKQPEDGPPEEVQPVDRFRRDMTCLMDLTSPAIPPQELYPAKHKTTFYVVGDASGNAKGVAVSLLRGGRMECGMEEQVIQCTRGREPHRSYCEVGFGESAGAS